MWRLTYKGKPIGPEFEGEQFVVKAYIRMQPIFHGLGWKKCP